MPILQECNNDNSAEATSSSKEQNQKLIFSYGVVTTASHKHDLDKSISKFFYANNIAFNISKNDRKFKIWLCFSK